MRNWGVFWVQQTMEDNTEALEKELTFTRFDRMSERYPDKTAVVYLGERFSI
jgi:long-chain acyl-CoA synthetase